VNGAPGASERLSSWDFFYALDMALACLISYAVSTYALSPFLNRPDAFLAGMWTTVATVFVFRTTRADALSAGISRLSATCVSSRCVWRTSSSCRFAPWASPRWSASAR
jgi:hypothetical protein